MTISKMGYDKVEVLDLPENVQDELCDMCPGNPAGTIINPDYHPLFRQWLIDNGHEVKCYFGWWSW